MEKEALMLLEEEEAMLSAATYLQLQIMKKETCKEEEIYLDEKLVAAQSILWTV